MTHKRHRTTFPASSVEILVLHKGERQKLLHFQNKVSEDRQKKQVQGRIYKHMTHKGQRRQRLLLPMGKYYCSIKARSRNSFTVSKELKTIGTKSTHLTSRLQKYDPKMAKKPTSHASFRKYYSSIKARSRNFFSFKIKLVKRDHKLGVQCRLYKHVNNIWHRRQQLMLPLGKYHCSIKARSRNSFTFKIKLVKRETTS